MTHRWFSLLDMAIVGVPVLAIGIWQLVSINREIARGRRSSDLPDGTSPERTSPEGPGHPIGEHRLDDR